MNRSQQIDHARQAFRNPSAKAPNLWDVARDARPAKDKPKPPPALLGLWNGHFGKAAAAAVEAKQPVWCAPFSGPSGPPRDGWHALLWWREENRRLRRLLKQIETPLAVCELPIGPPGPSPLMEALEREYPGLPLDRRLLRASARKNYSINVNFHRSSKRQLRRVS